MLSEFIPLVQDSFSLLIGSLIVPWTVLFFINHFSKHQFLSKRISIIFLISLFGFSLATNLFWKNTINGHIYYEWDTIIPGHLMITYTNPVITNSSYFEMGKGPQNILQPREGSWLAVGWSQFSLYLLWASITFVIYTFTFILMYKLGRPKASLARAFIILNLVSLSCGLLDSVYPIISFGVFMITSILSSPFYFVATFPIVLK